MGDGVSRIASLVLKESLHSCSVDPAECNKRVLLVDLVDHEESCDYRLVACPGAISCSAKVKLVDFDEHVANCEDTQGGNPRGSRFLVPRDVAGSDED